MTEPWASSTPTGAKFSEAIISSVDCCRCSSAATAAATSGSTSASEALVRLISRLLDQLGVRRRVQEVRNVAVRTDLEEPALAVRVRVDHRGVLLGRTVHRDDLTGHRRVHVAHRLGRLRLPAGLTGLYRRALLGQRDV